MKRALGCILGIAVFLVLNTTLSGLADDTDLIDRRFFVSEPDVSNVQISPDGRYISFLKAANGSPNLWVVKTVKNLNAAQPVTKLTSSVLNYRWSRDSKKLLFLVSHGSGSDLYSVSIPGHHSKKAGKRPIVKLIDGKGTSIVIYAMPDNQPNVMYLGLNIRDKIYRDVYRVNVSTGRHQLIRENVQAFSDFVFDNQGRLRLGIRESATGREVVRIDTPQPRVVFTCNPEERCHPIGFSSDNEAFYVETNRGQSDLARLGLICVETGEEISSETDSLHRVDFGYGLFSASSNVKDQGNSPPPGPR